MNMKKTLFTVAGLVVAGAVLCKVAETALRRFHGAEVNAKFDREVMDTLEHLGWPTGVGTLYLPHGDGEFTLYIGENELLIFDFCAQGLSFVSYSGYGRSFVGHVIPPKLRGINPTYSSFRQLYPLPAKDEAE